MKQIDLQGNVYDIKLENTTDYCDLQKELYNQIDNLERKNEELERRIIELMKQYRDKTNKFTDIKIKNEKAIAYLKKRENFDGEFFLHTDRLVQKILLGILEKGEEKEL